MATSVYAIRIALEERGMCVRTHPFDPAAPHDYGVQWRWRSARSINQGDVFNYRLTLLQFSSVCSVS